MSITVYRARRVVTMDRNRPTATHVAVRDGRILAVGDADCAEGWGAARADDRYADAVLLPGLIEAHAHVMAGGIWRYAYVGHYARTDPGGREWPGVETAEALIDRLAARAREAPGDGPLVAWGFDPNFVPGDRLSRDHLDRAAARPVVVMHSNFHVLTCNSAALGELEASNLPGVVRDPSGRATGELQEFEAMGPVMRASGVDFADLADEAGLRAYGEVARLCGVTTAADLLSGLHGEEVALLERVTAEEGFPIRYAPVMNAMEGDPGDEAARALALAPRSTERLNLGAAKLFTDGAIQGGTALLDPPGYFRMEDHGAWNMEPAHFAAAVSALHAAGVQTHIHTNGDAASRIALDAIEAACRRAPMADHRHVLEHAQLAGMAQFRRMEALGVRVNLFANHVHYFGDVHWSRSLGPDRARRMDAAADALAVFGDRFAIHSDAPVTPMGPLATAWCAVERRTAGGRRLGEAQRIGVEDALRCITLGAAHVLKMDHEVGSIACGKRADLCALAEDPLEADPARLREVAVLGTMMGGRPTEAA
jgi:predicted amidohydrolase YtcJ